MRSAQRWCGGLRGHGEAAVVGRRAARLRPVCALIYLQQGCASRIAPALTKPGIAETAAVVTIGAGPAPQHVVYLLGDDLTAIERYGEAELNLDGRPFRIQPHFLRVLEMQPQAERIAQLGAALLVVHCPVDDTVSVDNACVNFQAAQHPKSFVAIDGVNHLLTSKDDAAYVAGVMGQWASRCLWDRDGLSGALDDE